MEDYFEFHGIPVTHEKFSIEFVKRVIPHVGVHDERWKRFPMLSFDKDRYKAHMAMYNTIEDEFTRLIDEAEATKKEADEKKKQEQLEKISQDETFA